jgi:hypothetical protein
MGDTIKVKRVDRGAYTVEFGLDEFGPMRANEAHKLVGGQLKRRPNSIVMTDRYTLGPNPSNDPLYVIKDLRGSDVAGNDSAITLWKSYGPNMLLGRTVMAGLQGASRLVETAPGSAYSQALAALQEPSEVARTDPRLAFDLLLDKLARDKVPMSVWGERDYYWPEPMEFELGPDRKDRLGDFYEVTYLYVGDLNLAVVMNAGAFIDSEGEQPGTYKATYHGETNIGTWDSIEAIPKVLRKLIDKATRARREAERSLVKIGDPSKWKVTYDWDQLLAEYINPDNDGAMMNVTFQNVEDAVFGPGEGEAVISYAAGQDYEGAYGRQEEAKTYKSKKDAERVLKDAERLWTHWRAE